MEVSLPPSDLDPVVLPTRTIWCLETNQIASALETSQSSRSTLSRWFPLKHRSWKKWGRNSWIQRSFPGWKLEFFGWVEKKNARPKSHFGERCSFLCWHFGAGYMRVVIHKKKTIEAHKILLMEEILHQWIWRIYHSSQGFMDLRGCRISSIKGSSHYPKIKTVPS